MLGTRHITLPALFGFVGRSGAVHLEELTHAGLIVPRQDTRFVWYTADLDAMNGVVGYPTENCCRSSAVCDPECGPRHQLIAAVQSRPRNGDAPRSAVPHTRKVWTCRPV